MTDQVTGTPRPIAPVPAHAGTHDLVPSDWPTQVTDTIVDTVGKVRERTAEPARIAARGVVYGLLAAVLATVALVVLLILIIRLAANYIPGDIWIVYLVLGALFVAGGAVLWMKAFAAPADA